MKHFLLVLTVLFTIMGSEYALAGDVGANVQTGFEYSWWRDSEANAGYQMLVPVRLSSRYKDLSVSILSGYAYTGYDSHYYYGLTTLSQMLDTKLNLSYALLDKLPVDVLFGLDFNFPTASLNLSEEKTSLYMDPDLVSISQLGEGFNINPTLSVAKEWGRLITGVGIGYLWRGKYDYSKTDTDYDPGDIFTATAEARYEFSSMWSGRLFGQYARFGKDQLSDRPIYREGDVYIAGVGLGFSPKSWETSLTLRYIYRGKSELPEGYHSEDLAAMNYNIHGNEITGDLVVSYLLSEPTTLWVRITGLYIEDNDYPDSYYYYIGKRQKASVELGWKRTFGQHWEANLFLRGFTMHDGERTYPEYRDERTFNGFSAGGAIIAKF